MTLFDGEPTSKSAFERVLDDVLDARRLFLLAVIILSLSIVVIPLVIYLDFGYFTAKSMPRWLSAFNYLCVFGVLLSGAALLLLALARGIAQSHDPNHEKQ